MVISVEHELKTEDKELIRADSMPAATRPLTPAGNRCFISSGKVAPDSVIFKLEFGSCVKLYAIIPGITNINIGVIFKKPANIILL